MTISENPVIEYDTMRQESRAKKQYWRALDLNADPTIPLVLSALRVFTAGAPRC